MKTILVIILLFTFAFTAGSRLSKADSRKYKTGIKYFKNKQYKKSYKIFDTLFFKNLTNFNVNLYLGKSAFETKNYDVAISTYERMLISNSRNFKVQLELARTFFAIKDYKSAKEMLEKIKRNNKSKKVAKIIDKYLQIIEKETQKATTNFQGALIFRAGYDTNIYNRPFDDTFFIPAFKLDFNNTTRDESAIYNQEMIVLEHKYINGKFHLSNNLLILNKHFYSFEKKTTQIFSYSPSLHYQHTQDLKSSFKFNISKAMSESNTTSYGVTPKLSYAISNTATLEASLKYQKSDTIKVLENYDTIDLTFSLKNIIAPQILISSLAKVGTLRQIKTNSNKDYDVLQLVIGATYRFTNKLSMKLQGDYKNTNYKNIDNLYLIKRINNDIAYSLLSNYTINEQWLIKGAASYIDNKSNIPSNTYNKYDISVSIIKSF